MSDNSPVWFDIIPRIVGMGEASGNIVRESVTAGEESGKGFGDAFARMVSGTTGEVTASAERQVASLQATLERSSLAIVAAKDKVADANGRVLIAETKLAEAQQKFAADSSKVVAANVRLEEAKRRQVSASAAVVAATTDEVRVQETLAAAQERTAATTVSSGAAMSKAAGILTAGYVVAIGAAVNAAGDFESSQEKLVTTAGESRDSLDMVSQGILDMAGNVGYSADELSKGMYTVESAGYHGADGLKVMGAAAQGAREEGAELGEVTDAVTTALHDYHLSADDSALVTSKMVTAVGEGKTTFQEFASSLASVQPLAGAAGISIDDLYGSLASMTASGMSAQQATQNMADAIRHLQNVTAPMRNELSSIGVDADGLSASLSEDGLYGSMEKISTAIMEHMGPAGTVMLDTFNQSKAAANDAAKMFDSLPPAVQKVAQAVKDGTLSAAEYRKTAGGLSVDQKNLADQWIAVTKTADGFNSILKAGGNDAQTYTAALAKATGDASSMNVALMLTGENADKTADNIKNVAAATTEADGSVKGWHDTQETFNQKLNEFKDGMGAIGIEIGTDFLPAVSTLLGGLVDVGHWLTDNKWAVDALVISIGAAAGAFVVFKTASAVMSTIQFGTAAASAAMGLFTVAEEGATVGAGGLAAAFALTGIPELILGITATIAGIAALVAGIKYAYDNFQPFHDVVQSIWDTMKSFGSWVADTASSVWDALVHAFYNVEHAIGNVEHAFGNIEHAGENVGHAFGNVGHAISNVADFISKAVRIAAAVITTILVVPVVLALHAMEDEWHFLYEHAISPVLHMIQSGIDLFGQAMTWLHESAVQPALDGIATAWHWVYDNAIAPVESLIDSAVHAWGDLMHWIHEEIVQPALDGISSAWHSLWDSAIRPVLDSINTGVHAWGDLMHWIHEEVIVPVSDAIDSAVEGIGHGFTTAVDAIESAWSRISGIVKTPAKFVIDTVYNNAVVPVWNDIAGVFGLGSINPVDVSSWSGGGVYSGAGVIPGYAPGQDTVNAKLSPGESVLTPEATKLLGPDFILGINGMSGRAGGNLTNGMPIHAAGGFWGGLKSDIGGAWDDVKDAASLTAKMATDPVGSIKDLFAGALADTDSTPGDPSQWLTAIKSMPGKFVDAAADKVKAWFGVHPAVGSTGGGAPGVPYTGSGELTDWLTQATIANGLDPAHWVPGMTTLSMRESGGNPNAVNNWDSNAAAGHPSKGLTQTIQSTFDAYRNPSLSDNIFDPVANAAASERYIIADYGDINAVQQADASASPKGYSGGLFGGIESLIGRGDYTGSANTFGLQEDSPVVAGVLGLRSLLGQGDYTGNLRSAFGVEEDDPAVIAALGLRNSAMRYGIFDGGGTIPPGETVVNNMTGGNEYLLDGGATQALKAIVGAITGNSNAISDQVGFSQPAAAPSTSTDGTQSVVDSGGSATMTKPRSQSDIDAEYAGKFGQFFQDNGKDIFGSLAAGFGGVFIKDYHDNTSRNGQENARALAREMNTYQGTGSR